ncbi:hypothetical protein LR013_01810 [candidate division NPL-UPA2 bacterium]|nr:hypothetical protein [candidate division NPL-UPA2 bacterium]
MFSHKGMGSQDLKEKIRGANLRIIGKKGWQLGKDYIESDSGQIIVFKDVRHNFYGPSYEAILENTGWRDRLCKPYTQFPQSFKKAVEKDENLKHRSFKELASSNSSDALLMNVFCCPTVKEDIRSFFEIKGKPRLDFGKKFKNNGGIPIPCEKRSTEIDCYVPGNLIIEAKLTENNFGSPKSDGHYEIYFDVLRKDYKQKDVRTGNKMPPIYQLVRSLAYMLWLSNLHYSY